MALQAAAQAQNSGSKSARVAQLTQEITFDSLMKQNGLADTLGIIENMVQAPDNNRTSTGLGERCPIHGCGLNFFSSKE